MITKLEVEITGVKTDNRYFSFNYKITIDGKLKHEGVYDSDHAWLEDHKDFRKMLKDGHAAKLALERAL